MQHYRNGKTSVWVILLVSALVFTSLIAGCGQQRSDAPASDPAVSAPGLEVAWPPTGAGLHATSASPQVTGADFTDKSLNAEVDGTDLVLTTTAPSAQLAWAYFTIDGLALGSTITKITLNSTINPVPAASSTVLFIGLSNYTKQAWEWHAANQGEFILTPSATGNYVSNTGKTSIAVALWVASDPAVIHTLAIQTQGGHLNAPINLAATPEVGHVDLTWSAVPGAAGYYVERALTPSFSTVVRLNATPASEPAYTDTPVGAKIVYFYRVIAASGSLESLPSDAVSIFTPQTDWPAPQNFRVGQATTTSITLEWDWDGDNPGGFVLFVAATPDGQIALPHDESIPWFIHTYKISGLTAGQTIYARLLAKSDSGWYGRSTPELVAKAKNTWQWQAPVTVGTGHGPMAACQSSAGIAVAYFTASGVALATANGSSWTSAVILSDTGMGDYIDVSYSSAGKYCVATQSLSPDDLFAITGSPTSGWNSVSVHGDGSSSPGHALSGIACNCSASATEFAITHYDGTNSQWMLHTTPVGTINWSTSVLLPGAAQSACNIVYTNSGLAAAYYDTAQAKLVKSDAASSWVFSSALTPANDAIGVGVLLSYVNGEFWALGRKVTTADMHFLNGTTAPWSATKIGDLANVGYSFSPLESMQSSPVCGSYAASDGWRFVFRSGTTWDAQPISVAGATPGANGVIIPIGGTPYFIFEDTASGSIKCCAGIPPA
jgi:hypothetical protein